LALKLAKLAVVHAPSEYMTWAKLTEIYTDINDFESALLSLNSCPMFTYCERDAQRMPPPARTHLPLKPEQASLTGEDPNKIQPLNGMVSDENDPRENEVHPELARLPSLSLRGTFLKAYMLLIRIVSRVGWDDLLKYRSRVFVMEDEYRIHRALVEEMEKTAEMGAPQETAVTGRKSMEKDEESDTLGMETISLSRGRSPTPDGVGSHQRSPSRDSAGGKRPSVDVGKLLKDMPKKAGSEGSASTDAVKKGKAPVRFNLSFSLQERITKLY
jgi:hypothetical protein